MKMRYKFHLSFMLFMGIINICFSQGIIPPNNEWKDLGLIGKVKSLKEYSGYPSNKEDKTALENHSSYDYWEFDKSGLITSRYRFSEPNIKRTVFEHTYDDKKHLSNLSRNENGQVTYQWTYATSEDTLIEWMKDMASGLSEKSTYVYDEKSRLIDETDYSEAGFVKINIKYEYDLNGNLIKEICQEGSRISQISYTYDKKNHLISEIHSSDGEISSTSTFSFEYDKKGNWTKKVRLKNSEPLYILERKIEYY